MNRRTVLRRAGSLVSLGAAGLAGCTGMTEDETTAPATEEPAGTRTSTDAASVTSASPSTGTPSPTGTVHPAETHSVAVHYSLVSGFVPYSDELAIRDDGTYRYELGCASDESNDPVVTTGTVPPARHRRLQETVLETAVGELDSRYECTEQCPADDPRYRYRLLVDDAQRTVTFDNSAEIPSGLRSVHEGTLALLRELDLPDC